MQMYEPIHLTLNVFTRRIVKLITVAFNFRLNRSQCWDISMTTLTLCLKWVLTAALAEYHNITF